MNIQFTKMHGLGNDFVVINAVKQAVSITPEWVRAVANRHEGIGCDQVLVIGPSQNPQADFSYHIYNANGSEAYQCGNGARCVGLYIRQKNLSDKKTIFLETRRDVISVCCIDDNQVIVDIGTPYFDPQRLPFLTSQHAFPYTLQLTNRVIQFDVVSVGNPHCVLETNDFSAEEMKEIGQELNAHAAFPEGVNVGFAAIDSRDAIQLCVYERGAGLTKACGSGACAAVAVLRHRGKLNAAVKVHQEGGVLTVVWQSPTDVIQLIGPAVAVFDGEWLT